MDNTSIKSVACKHSQNTCTWALTVTPCMMNFTQSKSTKREDEFNDKIGNMDTFSHTLSCFLTFAPMTEFLW